MSNLDNIDDRTNYLQALVSRAQELVENESAIKEMKQVNKPKQKRFYTDEQKAKLTERLAGMREKAQIVRAEKKKIKDCIKADEQKDFEELKKKYIENKKNGGTLDDIKVKEKKTNNRIRNEPVIVETPKPVVVETPKPVIVETPKPVVVETPKPVVNTIPKPAYYIPHSKWNKGFNSGF
jgi:hypothetical protein